MAQFYYGKYLLPEIPVLEGYPYIVIRKNEDSGNFELIFFETYCYYEMSNKRICYDSMSTKKSQKYKLPIWKNFHFLFKNKPNHTIFCIFFNIFTFIIFQIAVVSNKNNKLKCDNKPTVRRTKRTHFKIVVII